MDHGGISSELIIENILKLIIVIMTEKPFIVNEKRRCRNG